MDEEERKVLVAELLEKTKSALVLEAKADIEKVQKLIVDGQKKNDEALKGLITQGELKTYEEKSEKKIKEYQNKIEELETKMQRLPIENPDDGKKVKEGAAEYKAAFFNFLNTGLMPLDEKAEKYRLEFKALVSDATGQILIPEEIETEIYRALPNINKIRQYATVRPIMRDRISRKSLTEVLMAWGKLETGKVPVETTVVPSEDWQYVEDLNGLAKIGKDELADSPYAIEPTIVDSFARARSDKEEVGFISGAGHASQEPDGILTGTVVTRVKTAAHDAIASDDVLNLIYALPEQYQPNAVLMFPNTTILALRKLKDAVSGQYMWQPSLQAGQPPSFAGYPVIAQRNIPAIASSAECDIGIFGDLKAGYRILDRQGMTMQRLVEIFATAGLIGLLAGSRVGGGVIRPDAIRILQELAGG